MNEHLSSLVARCYEIAVRPRVRIGSVYLLLAGDEVIYIGQTLNVEQRIAWHYEQGKTPTVTHWQTNETRPNIDYKPFDRAFAFDVEETELSAVEGALIRFFCPRFNRPLRISLSRPVWRVARLGLPLHADENANAVAFMKRLYTPRPHTKGPRRATIVRDRSRQRERARRLWDAVEAAWKARAS